MKYMYNWAIKYFETVFRRPHRYSIALKVILFLFERHEIFTTNWPGIELCQYVVSIKIDNTKTTINTNLWNHLKTNFATSRPAIENPGTYEWGVWQITSVKIEKKNCVWTLKWSIPKWGTSLLVVFKINFSYILLSVSHSSRPISTDYLCTI